MKRLLALLIIAAWAMVATGCAGGRLSQGLARTAAAISGPDVTQGLLGHVSGDMTFVPATDTEPGHFLLPIDGDGNAKYSLRIFDWELLEDALKLKTHDAVSFAGRAAPPQLLLAAPVPTVLDATRLKKR